MDDYYLDAANKTNSQDVKIVLYVMSQTEPLDSRLDPRAYFVVGGDSITTLFI